MSCKQKWYAVIVSFFFLISSAVAASGMARVGKAELYYQYFPNSKSSFKGTVVFQNGSGTTLQEWTKNKDFFHCIRNSASIFLYDRSGLGKSPADLRLSTTRPMTAKFIVSKFKRLLLQQHIPGPYVLVAHSYGAMYAGYFAKKYPQEVRALVLIDPVPPKYKWSKKLFKMINTTYQQIAEMEKMSSKQLYTKYSFANSNKYNTISAQLFYQLIGFDKTKNQLSKLPALSNKIPVVILSSSYMQKNAPIQGSWFQLQKQWLNGNKESRIVRFNSGHSIQLFYPQQVCHEIKSVLSSHELKQ